MDDLQHLLDKQAMFEGVAMAMASQLMEKSVKKMRGRLEMLYTDITLLSPSDLRSLALQTKDLADHMEILSYLKGAQLTAAAKIASELETASRDILPASVWNLLLKYMPVTQS